MIRTLEIHGFRAFDRLRLDGLTRVNLLVGRNNCGKTSVLEAVEMLGAVRNPSLLLAGLRRRGEALAGDEETWATRRPGRPELALDVRHLFHGHALDGARAELRVGTDARTVHVVSVSVERAEDAGSEINSQLKLFAGRGIVSSRWGESERVLLGRSAPSSSLPFGEGRVAEDPPFAAFPILATGAVLAEFGDLVAVRSDRDARQPSRFISTSGWSGAELLREWNRIVGTAAEDRVVEVMRILDGNLDRVLVLGPPHYAYDAGGAAGAFVRRVGDDDRIPLGSMGDGMRRLLVLAVALARAEGGALLVDEIDTGLHYTALQQLWQFVLEGARRLDVQVFATSHSQDCIDALASTAELGAESDVSVHRIAAGHDPSSVAYSAAELIAAAARGIEMRGL